MFGTAVSVLPGQYTNSPAVKTSGRCLSGRQSALVLLCPGFPAQLSVLDGEGILAKSMGRSGDSRGVRGRRAAWVSPTAGPALRRHWGLTWHLLLVPRGQCLTSFTAWKPPLCLSLPSFSLSAFSGCPTFRPHSLLQTPIPIPSTCLPSPPTPWSWRRWGPPPGDLQRPNLQEKMPGFCRGPEA